MTALEPRLFPVEQRELTSDDYYTPAWVFERMDLTFDLDVASPPGGIPWIPAARYFTMADDGLAQPWEGRVWMNPPFSGTGPLGRQVHRPRAAAPAASTSSCSTPTTSHDAKRHDAKR